MSISETVQRQKVILEEQYAYVSRDVGKYAKGAIGMWSLFWKNADLGDAYQSTYLFFCHLDDIFDGDRAIDGDPLVYIGEIKSGLQTGNMDYKRYPIFRLMAHSIDHLER